MLSPLLRAGHTPLIVDLIAASLVWLWLTEGQRPALSDLIGACIAIGGALVILGFASKAR